MKLASNQPYFFPYLGYFGLIKHTDIFIMFDVPQYINQGWINRNRILKPVNGWQYINVPVRKHSHKTPVKEVKIADDDDWKRIIIAKLIVYKKFAPFYRETLAVVEKSISINTNSITVLNCNAIKEICNYLEIDWNCKVFSEMNLNFIDVNEPDEWALYTCKSLGNVSEYWNLPGGVKLYNREKFNRHNIILKFYNQVLNPYNQRRQPFESGLSIIDVMMFNSKEEINRQLDNYYLIT